MTANPAQDKVQQCLQLLVQARARGERMTRNQLSIELDCTLDELPSIVIMVSLLCFKQGRSSPSSVIEPPYSF